MVKTEEKIAQVKAFFQNGDTPLGLRRLIDCALDTQNTTIYKHLLQLIEDSEQNPAQFVWHERADSLLTEMSNFKQQHTVQRTEKPLLQVSELQKRYRKGAFSISPIDFSLEYGQVVGLVGENGNGKTSLLRLLALDLEPDKGSIQYQLPQTHKDIFQLRSRLIYIPQRVPRWYGSLMDNLQFTLAMHGIKGEDNLLWVELMIARLGLRPYKHMGWSRISSGYRTRFELAKSLLRRPSMMLLDEPLSNLDIISQQTILQDLKFLSESTAHPFGLVLSSQQLYEVEKISDLVIFLSNGQPQYQHKQTSTPETSSELIYEIESEASREHISQTFTDAGLLKVTYNGGVYVLHFKTGTSNKDIYAAISQHDLQLNYIRNITFSSRRFFIR